MNVFATYLDSGFGLLGGDVRFLSQTLIALDITLAGLWVLAGAADVIARLVKKMLYIGFFAFLIGNFNGLAKIIFDSFSGLSLKADDAPWRPTQVFDDGAKVYIEFPLGIAQGEMLPFFVISPEGGAEFAFSFHPRRDLALRQGLRAGSRRSHRPTRQSRPFSFQAESSGIERSRYRGASGEVV